MNDFTIEELEWLLETVDYCIEEFEEQNPAYSIQCKLKDMIVNYCEHEKVVPNYGPNTQCDKCGEIW